MTLISQLEQYFKAEKPFGELGIKNLPTNYNWPRKGAFPSYSHLFRLNMPTGSNYEKNTCLKQNSPRIWQDGDKSALASWIIADWGGIRGNNPATIQSYVDAISNCQIPTDLKGVASYSKVLSFMDPNKYAIYDARVAISLNAIQLLSKAKRGKAFCYLPGRNTALARFRSAPQTQITALQGRGWKQIEPKDCYKTYLSTLKATCKKLPGAKLYQLEMSLFADAEKLAKMYLRQKN